MSEAYPSASKVLHSVVVIATIATIIVAFCGIAWLSLMPSAKARQSGILRVDIGDLRVGDYKIIEFRGRPVAIFRSDNNWHVYALVPSHVGCTVQFVAPGVLPPLEHAWPGGWIDPCRHGSWDLRGRPLRWNSLGNELPLPPIPWRQAPLNQIELGKE